MSYGVNNVAASSSNYTITDGKTKRPEHEIPPVWVQYQQSTRGNYGASVASIGDMLSQGKVS